MPRRKIPVSEHSVIARRYRQGETIYEIAPSYGVGPVAIANLLRKLGVKLRPQGFRMCALCRERLRQQFPRAAG